MGVKMIKTLISGLPGKMSSTVAQHLLKEEPIEFYVMPYALTGPEITEKEHTINFTRPSHYFTSSSQKFTLIKPDERESMVGALKERWDRNVIAVDYSHPSAVNANADFYCKHNIPFVMGTTGGDRNALEQKVRDSEIVAVIAPNMAKQIVAFQAMMQYAAQTFPDAFKGYSLEIVESHQHGKADTSGTAKAMVKYFNSLGVPFSEDQIVKIRDPYDQAKIGVPKEALGGHGWHTYMLKSDDGSVMFEFTHNVAGRDIYALGTLDSLRFLDKKVWAGEKGKVYSMIDVLTEK